MAKLRDVIEKVIDCEHKTAPETSEEPYAYSVGTPHIRNGRILFDELKPISRETYFEWTKRGEPEPGDLVLAREAPVGQVGFVTGKYRVALGQRTVLLKVNRTVCVPRYLHYKMISPRMQNLMHSLSEGSTVAHLNVRNIPKIDIGEVPVIEEQNRIAEILGSLDDKIEANNALIDSLEKLADLEFLSLLDEKSDAIEETTYGSLNVFGGGTPSTKKPEYWEGEVNWVTPTDVTSLSNHVLFESSRKITEAGLTACSSKLHPAGSIMMTSRASIGFFAVNQKPAATNQGFIVLEPENEDVRWWVYHHMKRDVDLFLQLSNGATFMELSRGMFKSLPLKLYKGETPLKDIHNQIIALASENVALAETRDLLIRKLIR